jgi:hypothetical protein
MKQALIDTAEILKNSYLQELATFEIEIENSIFN